MVLNGKNKATSYSFVTAAERTADIMLNIQNMRQGHLAPVSRRSRYQASHRSLSACHARGSATTSSMLRPP
jgi:transposase-like protein